MGFISLRFLRWKVTHCWWEENASPNNVCHGLSILRPQRLNFLTHHNYMKGSELIRKANTSLKAKTIQCSCLQMLSSAETSKQISAFVKVPQLQISHDEFEWSNTLFRHEVGCLYVQPFEGDFLEFFKMCCPFAYCTKSPPSLCLQIWHLLDSMLRWNEEAPNRLGCLCFAKHMEFNKYGWPKMSPNWPIQKLILTCSSLVYSLQN